MEGTGEVQILFKFYSDFFEEDMVETLWAKTEDADLGFYSIDSLPFYIAALATDDVVHAEYDDAEGMLVYVKTVKPSGNSIIWVVVTADTADIEQLREDFLELDCISDAISDRFFTMEIKKEVNYLFIKNKLNELRSEGIIDFVEPCISAMHQY